MMEEQETKQNVMKKVEENKPVKNEVLYDNLPNQTLLDLYTHLKNQGKELSEKLKIDEKQINDILIKRGFLKS